MNPEKVASAKEELKKKLILSKDTDSEVKKDLLKESRTRLSCSLRSASGQYVGSFSFSQNDTWRDYDKTFDSIDGFAAYAKKFFEADPDLET